MKLKTALKRSTLKKGDILVKRRGHLYRINKQNPRRKAKQA